MTVKEMAFVRDMLAASISDLETAFEDASPFMPMTESVQRTIKMLNKAKATVIAANEREWDRIEGKAAE
jgi:hypothetical protein